MVRMGEQGSSEHKLLVTGVVSSVLTFALCGTNISA